MIPTLTAIQFNKFMKSGRTSPAILGCEDESGTWAGEYVVKLRGGSGVGNSGLLREFFAAQLAQHFRIETPEPAVIRVEEALARLIASSESTYSEVILASVGLNFGTRVVTGYGTWAIDRPIPESLWRFAAEIFAFDALIQNPDRRFNNPNLLTQGDSVLIFDHELAFSFLLDIFSSPEPWQLEKQRMHLENHVFYRKLKAKPIDLQDFVSFLLSLTNTVLEGMVAEIPNEWNNEYVDRIVKHLVVLREHSEEFVQEVQRFLA
jgi:hypothetical protein